MKLQAVLVTVATTVESISANDLVNTVKPMILQSTIRIWNEPATSSFEVPYEETNIQLDKTNRLNMK